MKFTDHPRYYTVKHNLLVLLGIVVVLVVITMLVGLAFSLGTTDSTPTYEKTALAYGQANPMDPAAFETVMAYGQAILKTPIAPTVAAAPAVMPTTVPTAVQPTPTIAPSMPAGTHVIIVACQSLDKPTTRNQMQGWTTMLVSFDVRAWGIGELTVSDGVSHYLKFSGCYAISQDFGQTASDFAGHRDVRCQTKSNIVPVYPAELDREMLAVSIDISYIYSDSGSGFIAITGRDFDKAVFVNCGLQGN